MTCDTAKPRTEPSSARTMHLYPIWCGRQNAIFDYRGMIACIEDAYIEPSWSLCRADHRDYDRLTAYHDREHRLDR